MTLRETSPVEAEQRYGGWHKLTSPGIGRLGLAGTAAGIGGLVLAFTTIVGADFVHGSAMAKLVNTGTNLGALIVFGVTGHVHWLLGAAMAVCNIGGAMIGARMALSRGSGFVRVVLLVVVLALIAKLGFDQFSG